MGAPLLVRMFVPLWVVNATPLPVAAWVVPIQAPPPPSDREQGQSEGLMDAGESIRLKTLETESVQSSQGSSRRFASCEDSTYDSGRTSWLTTACAVLPECSVDSVSASFWQCRADLGRMACAEACRRVAGMCWRAACPWWPTPCSRWQPSGAPRSASPTACASRQAHSSV